MQRPIVVESTGIEVNCPLMTQPRAFTLIETIIAISVLGLAVIAALQLSISSNRSARVLMERFTAHHLSEEGLEVIRNVRDGNWMKNLDWRYGLEDGRYEIIERDPLTPPSLLPPKEHALFSLKKINSIQESTEITTRPEQSFRRMVEISTPRPEEDIMLIRSIVEFETAQLPQRMSLEMELSDWRQGRL